ncbi:MAG: tetratricopeptide repeat protein, partial [Vicinamibacteria bacterium]
MTRHASASAAPRASTLLCIAAGGVLTLVALSDVHVAARRADGPAPAAVASQATPRPPARATSKGKSAARPSTASLDEVARKADAAREAGHLEEAVPLYEQVLASRPRWVEGWWYLGTSLYDLEDWPGARRAFDRVLRLDDDN